MHDDVEPPAIRLRLRDEPEQFVAPRGVDAVRAHRLPIGGASRGKPRGERGRRVALHIRDRDTRAGGGERIGDRRADALRRARHERGAAAKIGGEPAARRCRAPRIDAVHRASGCMVSFSTCACAPIAKFDSAPKSPSR